MMGPAPPRTARWPVEGDDVPAATAWRDNPWVTWLVGLVVAIAFAAAAGGAVAGVVRALGGADGWRDLATVAAGLVVGVSTLALGWLAVIVVMLRRYVPVGRRVLVAAVSVAALVVVAVGLATVTAAERLPGGVTVPVIAAVAVVVPPLVVRRAMRGARPPAPDCADDEPAG